MINERPASVVGMTRNFGALRCPPTKSVFGHGLLARSRIRRCGTSGKGTFRISPPLRLAAAGAQG
eukprot:4089849-Pleurochrysis_carterae.AAC.1